MKYTISNETAAKLEAVKPTSKYYLTPTDEKNKYYVKITAENGTALKVPFKAMFFKENNNKKLGKILSISNSSTHCSSHAKGFCQLNNPQNECYGLKTENQYKRNDIINSYESNLISGLILNAANVTYLSNYINNQLKPDYIRFNKHGDFINHQQFLKLLNLVENCKNTIFYGYTCRDDILSSYNITSDFLKEVIPNLRINGSNKLYTNRFKVTYSLKEYTQANNICLGTCLKCKKCINQTGRVIYCLYHGSNKETVLNTAENRKFIKELLNALNINITAADLQTHKKLYDSINNYYIKNESLNLKDVNINNTKELIDNIILNLKDLKTTAAAGINKKYLKKLNLI